MPFEMFQRVKLFKHIFWWINLMRHCLVFRHQNCRFISKIYFMSCFYLSIVGKIKVAYLNTPNTPRWIIQKVWSVFVQKNQMSFKNFISTGSWNRFPVNWNIKIYFEVNTFKHALKHFYMITTNNFFVMFYYSTNLYNFSILLRRHFICVAHYSYFTLTWVHPPLFFQSTFSMRFLERQRR